MCCGTVSPMKENPIPGSSSAGNADEIAGKILYDQHGNPIGIATNDAGFDYGPTENKTDVVLVIKPSKPAPPKVDKQEE